MENRKVKETITTEKFIGNNVRLILSISNKLKRESEGSTNMNCYQHWEKGVMAK